MPILMEKEEEGTLSPILAHGGVRFMWIKHNNLYRILYDMPRVAGFLGVFFNVKMKVGEWVKWHKGGYIQ